MAKELKKKAIYLVIGGPGCGKGTQCKRLAEEMQLIHVSTGDLLRKEIEEGTDIGNSAKEAIASGGLVPTETVTTLLKNYLIKESANAPKGFLIDGYPREMSQVQAFEKNIAQPVKILYFEVSNDTMKSRCLTRNTGRADDNEDTITKRIELFRSTGQPIIDFYTKKKKLCKISGEGSPDEVFSLAKNAITAKKC